MGPRACVQHAPMVLVGAAHSGYRRSRSQTREKPELGRTRALAFTHRNRMDVFGDRDSASDAAASR